MRAVEAARLQPQQSVTIAYVNQHGQPVEYMVYKDIDLWFGKQSAAR